MESISNLFQQLNATEQPSHLGFPYTDGCLESALNYQLPDSLRVQRENFKKFNLHYQNLTNLESGFGSQFDPSCYRVRPNNYNASTSARMAKSSA